MTFAHLANREKKVHTRLISCLGVPIDERRALPETITDTFIWNCGCPWACWDSARKQTKFQGALWPPLKERGGGGGLTRRKKFRSKNHLKVKLSVNCWEVCWMSSEKIPSLSCSQLLLHMAKGPQHSTFTQENQSGRVAPAQPQAKALHINPSPTKFPIRTVPDWIGTKKIGTAKKYKKNWQIMQRNWLWPRILSWDARFQLFFSGLFGPYAFQSTKIVTVIVMFFHSIVFNPVQDLDGPLAGP